MSAYKVMENFEINEKFEYLSHILMTRLMLGIEIVFIPTITAITHSIAHFVT